MEQFKKLFYLKNEIEKERQQINQVKNKLIKKKADLESKLSNE